MILYSKILHLGVSRFQRFDGRAVDQLYIRIRCRLSLHSDQDKNQKQN